MKKTIFRTVGIIFTAMGTLFILSSFEITGLVISENLIQKTGSFLGIILIIGGIIFLIAGREEKESELEIFISNKALERSKKDSFVRENLAQYREEIRMIAANPQTRPQEQVGEFRVSPRSHKNIRVAWHYDKQNHALYIDDLLYHKKEHEYVDKWNRKASRKRITRKDYQETGYREATEL